MTRHALEAKLAELQSQADTLRANLHATEGAMQILRWQLGTDRPATAPTSPVSYSWPPTVEENGYGHAV